MEIKNVKIINPNETIENANVIIEKSKIAKIFKKEGQGNKILVPGFINSHIHGFLGKDAMDQNKKSIEFIAKEIIKFGTTSFFPTFMTSSENKLTKAFKEASKAKSQGAKIQGFNLEGPFISKVKKGAHDPRFIEPFNIKLLKFFQKKAQNLIRKITFDPDNAKLKNMKETKDLNIMPSIGHSNASLKTCNKFLKENVSSYTHLWNGMSGVINRNPGVAQSALNSGDKVFVELICDLLHVDKETIQLTIKAKGVNNVIVVTDAISCAKMKDGKYFSGGLEVIKKGDKITLSDNKSLAGSSITMYDAFKNLLSLNYSLNEVVKMTSYNCAKHFKLEKLGLIKENYYADITVLDHKLEIQKVLVNGKEKFSR